MPKQKTKYDEIIEMCIGEYTKRDSRIQAWSKSMRKFFNKKKLTMRDLDKAMTLLQELQLLSHRQGNRIVFTWTSDGYKLKYKHHKVITSAIISHIRTMKMHTSLIELHKQYEAEEKFQLGDAA